jgi:hypothetical protein
MRLSEDRTNLIIWRALGVEALGYDIHVQNYFKLNMIREERD